MAKVSNYTRTRIELLYKQGLHPAGILRSLKSEGLLVSLQFIEQQMQKRDEMTSSQIQIVFSIWQSL